AATPSRAALRPAPALPFASSNSASPSSPSRRWRSVQLSLLTLVAPPHHAEARDPEPEHSHPRRLRDHEIARVDAEQLTLALAREVGQVVVRDHVGRDRIDVRVEIEELAEVERDRVAGER